MSCSESNQRKTTPLADVYGVGQGQIWGSCWGNCGSLSHEKKLDAIKYPSFPWQKRTCCSNIWELRLKSSSKYSSHSYGIKGKILWLTLRTESAQMMFPSCLNLWEKFKAYQKFSWFPWKQDFNLWIKTAQGPKCQTQIIKIFFHIGIFKIRGNS